MLLDTTLLSGSLEETPAQTNVRKKRPVIMQSVGEDFPGSLPADETSGLAVFPAIEEFRFMRAAFEDFAGSLPADEGSPAALLSSVRVLPNVSAQGEDFAGSLPFEDATLEPLLFSKRRIWRTVVPEEFAGSLLADEDGPTLFLSPPRTPPVIAARGEDFAGSLPLEEVSLPPLLIPDRHIWRTVVPEEFAGSLPLEEAHAQVFLFPVVASLPSTIDEEFAGSLPLEEDSAQVSLVVRASPFARSIDEEFAGSMTDEAGVPAILFPLKAMPPVFTQEEDFAGSLPLEESFLTPRIARRSWIGVSQFGEDFVSPPQGQTFLLAMGGARWADDYFFMRGPDAEKYANLTWELGLDDFDAEVTFRQFEQRILSAQHYEAKRAEFTQMTTTFGEEAAARAKLVKQIITVAGVSYVVWRVLMWL